MSFSQTGIVRAQTGKSYSAIYNLVGAAGTVHGVASPHRMARNPRSPARQRGKERVPPTAWCMCSHRHGSGEPGGGEGNDDLQEQRADQHRSREVHTFKCCRETTRTCVQSFHHQYAEHVGRIDESHRRERDARQVEPSEKRGEYTRRTGGGTPDSSEESRCFGEPKNTNTRRGKPLGRWNRTETSARTTPSTT